MKLCHWKCVHGSILSCNVFGSFIFGKHKFFLLVVHSHSATAGLSESFCGRLKWLLAQVGPAEPGLAQLSRQTSGRCDAMKSFMDWSMQLVCLLCCCSRVGHAGSSDVGDSWPASHQFCIMRGLLQVDAGVTYRASERVDFASLMHSV